MKNVQAINTLNSMQLVLRGLTESLVVSGAVDPAKLSLLLQLFGESHAQGDAIAQAMLRDLAAGVDVLAQLHPAQKGAN